MVSAIRIHDSTARSLLKRSEISQFYLEASGRSMPT
ncbi:uncharacterized protein METZ01_LOCUS17997 [marine metagenome]|uniref:Uncharacterized protein n=1 Tax=marine metagenome TaxID=408172 RepID=A0A381PI71_9ZZZZ